MTSKIIEKARSLFDVAGARRSDTGSYLLILGLESTVKRNLDEFGHVNGRFQMYGFARYAGPKLKALIDFIRRQGFTAEPAGRYGYPLEGEINLKTGAIRAGLGKRGKSSVVLHPAFGARLRFMTLTTDAPMEQLTGREFPDESSPLCEDCSICIEVCPTGALVPFRMPDTLLCLSNISPVDKKGRSVLCDKCLHECPANKNLT